MKIPALVVCLMIAFAATAMADGNCSIATVQGTYAVSYTGYVFPPTPLPILPFAVVGTVKIDRNGITAANLDVVTPGGANPSTGSGIVTVNHDCTGKVTYPTFTENFLILNNGEEIRLMNLASASSGTARRMTSSPNGIRNCSVRDLSGVYAQTCTGNLFLPGPTLFQASFLGTLSSSGAGKFEGGGTMVFGGASIHL